MEVEALDMVLIASLGVVANSASLSSSKTCALTLWLVALLESRTLEMGAYL